jgi:hypothetical protein
MRTLVTVDRRIEGLEAIGVEGSCRHITVLIARLFGKNRGAAVYGRPWVIFLVFQLKVPDFEGRSGPDSLMRHEAKSYPLAGRELEAVKKQCGGEEKSPEILFQQAIHRERRCRHMAKLWACEYSSQPSRAEALVSGSMSCLVQALTRLCLNPHLSDHTLGHLNAQVAGGPAV